MSYSSCDYGFVEKIGCIDVTKRIMLLQCTLWNDTADDRVTECQM